MPLFKVRFNLWLSRLAASRPCTSQQMAHDLLVGQWIEVNRDVGTTKSFLAYLQQRRFCPEHGWREIGPRAAYWDLNKEILARIYLHADGGIVMQRRNTDPGEIIFTLPPGNTFQPGQGFPLSP